MTIDQTLDDDIEFARGDEEEERSSGYRERPWWWLKNEGDIAILRFLEESPDWRKVPTHRFFPTKPEPKDHEGKWPKQMPATCRATPAISGRYPQGCAIDSSGYKGEYGKGSKAEDVRYTMAVEREEYKDENGRRRYRDKEIQVPVFDRDTGVVSETETIGLPSLVLIGETMFRMMSAVKATAEATGSLRVQDIRLKLGKNPSGSGLIVTAIPLDRDDSIMPGTARWDIYQHAQKLWKPRGLVLGREIQHRASPEYWDRFFLMEDGRTYKEHELSQGGGLDQFASGKSGTTEQPDAAKLAQMRARIMGD